MNNKKLTARRYLEQIQEFDIYINQDLERLDDMKTNACSTGAIDYSKDRVQTTMMVLTMLHRARLTPMNRVFSPMVE